MSPADGRGAVAPEITPAYVEELLDAVARRTHFRMANDRFGFVPALLAEDRARRQPAPDGGTPGEVERLTRERDALLTDAEFKSARFRRLLVAFHDATRRPLGVTPASGDEFYDWRLAEKAEASRPRYGMDDERAERLEVRLVATERALDEALRIGVEQADKLAVAERALAETRAALERIRDLDRRERRICVDVDPAGCTYEVHEIAGPFAEIARAALAARLAPPGAGRFTHHNQFATDLGGPPGAGSGGGDRGV